MAVSQEQLGEFEAAFQRFAGGQDTLSRDALKTEMRALGFKPTEEELRTMMKEASSSGSSDSITFTEFQTMLSERMSRLDPSDDIVQAFECFDPHMTGLISQKQFKDLCSEGQDRLTEREIREIAKLGENSDNPNSIDYNELVSKMCGNK